MTTNHAFVATPLAQDDALFDGKSIAVVTATMGDVVRVWDDTPHVAIVPALDNAGKRFEFVFEGGRKDLFDAGARGLLSASGLSIEAIGFWRKRTWKKTRSAAGGWGHTWQFVAAQWTIAQTETFPTTSSGSVPDTMVNPIKNPPTALPIDKNAHA